MEKCKGGDHVLPKWYTLQYCNACLKEMTQTCKDVLQSDTGMMKPNHGWYDIPPIFVGGRGRR